MALPCAGGADDGIDLASRYPATLRDVVTERGSPCAWDFDPADIHQLSSFALSIGPALRVDIGPADVGIGHCTGGAVWALIVPRMAGWATTSVAGRGEAVDHVWLRFHPSRIGILFPRSTVVGPGREGLCPRTRWVAAVKLRGSWHSGNLALVPAEKEGTVDFDTRAGVRRFFAVDFEAGKADYVPAFESRSFQAGRPIRAEESQLAFDKLWKTFDRQYPMFVLRPELRWAELGERYRREAAGARTRQELAVVFAAMLRQLRDLHVGVSVDGEPVPVFERSRPANANPSAIPAVVGPLQRGGRRVNWARTADDIGYVCIQSWDDAAIPEQFDAVLERLRDTRGLIIDVRLNGGGDERLAQAVAGRFAETSVVYAYSRYRNGPKHADLTEKMPRQVGPRGPWRYVAPVVALIGQRCMSSTESFIAMMDQFPQVTTMGDRTAGSSGNPETVELLAGLSVTCPRWIDYRVDGEPLDERGMVPDVPSRAESAAFEGNRDDLLQAALERLRRNGAAFQPCDVR